MKDLFYVQVDVDKKVYKIVKKTSDFLIKKENKNEVVITLNNIQFNQFIDNICIREIINWKNDKIKKSNLYWRIILASNYEVIIKEGNNFEFQKFNNICFWVNKMKLIDK